MNEIAENLYGVNAMKCDCSYKYGINEEFSLKNPNLATKNNPKSAEKKVLGVFTRLHRSLKYKQSDYCKRIFLH